MRGRPNSQLQGRQQPMQETAASLTKDYFNPVKGVRRGPSIPGDWRGGNRKAEHVGATNRCRHVPAMTVADNGQHI
jgi:hypothetical protein